MVWLVMGERALQCFEVLAQADEGRLSVEAGDGFLAVSLRQMLRLLKRYRTVSRHRSNGRTAPNQIHGAKPCFARALIRGRYLDIDPTLAADKLSQDHTCKVSRETLRNRMISNALWFSRKEWRYVHQPRLHREGFGKLIQIDVFRRR